METKDPIKATSLIITFCIFLIGAGLSFWIYQTIIQNEPVISSSSAAKIEINSAKLEEIQQTNEPSIAVPEEGFGRADPFVPYK